MASHIHNLLEPSSFESLTDIPQQKVLSKLIRDDYLNMQLVSFGWWKVITPILNKPCHVLLTDIEQDVLKYVVNCTRTWINSLTVENWTGALPIYSSTRIDLPRTKKLVLKKGISDENLLKFFRYYANTRCDSLLLSGNCLGTLKLHQIKGFQFKHLTEFSFDFHEVQIRRRPTRYFPRLNFPHYRPPIALWSNNKNERLPKYVTDKNCPHIQALIKLLDEINIPTLKKVGGVFPFGTHNTIWKSLHTSFGKCMQRHGPNIESLSMKIQGPLRWMVPFLENELKPLVNLIELNLQFSFLIPHKYTERWHGINHTRLVYSLGDPSLTTKHGIRLLQIIRGFPKLKSYASNLRYNIYADIPYSDNAIHRLRVHRKQQRTFDIIHKLVFQRYARQLESFEFIATKYCWLAKSKMNFPNLKLLICEELNLNRAMVARGKRFILPSLTHLVINKPNINIINLKRYINWIGFIAPNLQTLEFGFGYDIRHKPRKVNNLTVKKIIVGLPNLQNLIFSLYIMDIFVNPDYVDIKEKLSWVRHVIKVQEPIKERVESSCKGVSWKYYANSQKKTSSTQVLQLCVEIDRH